MADTDQETQHAPQEGQNGPESAADNNSGTELPPEENGPENGTESANQKDPEMFSREYVEQLRAEGKAARLKAAGMDDLQKRADWLQTEVRRYAIREAAAAAGLVDPESLAWSDDYTDPETGLADHDQLRVAAEKLIKDRPYLARPRGPLPGQGQHSDADDGLSLSALLRA